MSNELFHISSLAIGRGRKQLASSIHLTIAPSEWVGVFGLNGVGKTTFLRTLLGLESPVSGVITFRGVDVTRGLPTRVRQAIGYLPQSVAMLPEITLSDFYSATWRARCRGNSEAKRRAIDEALAHVRLLDKQDIALSYLSGGELRRAMFGAMLIIKPEFCILDEPTAALDPQAEEEMKNILSRIEGSVSQSGLIVSHDEQFLHSTCHKVFELTPKGLVAAEYAPLERTDGVSR
ncbi:MAG: ATP-binding cassette domain-containing protein [Bdellovibrionota bacterium]